MPLVNLDLFSEPYSPSGNVAADGVKKLLGAPRLDLLQTLVRESVQNSCDAAKKGEGPEVHFRLRRLSPEQMDVMGSVLLSQLPRHEETSAPVRSFLGSESPWVLEICDFGTTGLGGPTRADIAPAHGDDTDFVDFIRNVGSKRNTVLGGGTYGYGKSALYLASNCGLIIVDSETSCSGKPARRLIGAQLGEAYDDPNGTSATRYTGRHWWGRLDEGVRFVEPVEGIDAAELSLALGMPERGAMRTGTTIMIVSPQFIDGNVADAVGCLQEALLWYFWPRMMRDVPASRRLRVVVELDGVVQRDLVPEDTPPLDLFCEAMRGLRQQSHQVQSIDCQKPIAALGRLNIIKGMRGERIGLKVPERSLFPATSRHIAVMRPVELVVRYYEGEPLPQETVEWAGVFITSHDPVIEKAFADSEPPAHDDWQPEMLLPGHPRTYVRVAVRRLKEAAQSISGGVLSKTSGSREAPSLAHIADIFGKALGSANGHGAGLGSRTEGGGSGGGGAGRRGFAISRPVFGSLDEKAGGLVAIFRAEVRNDAAIDLVLDLEPSLVLDGSAASLDLVGRQVDVLEARRPDGEVFGNGPEILLGGYSGPIEIVIAMPEDFAVTVKASLRENVGS